MSSITIVGHVPTQEWRLTYEDKSFHFTNESRARAKGAMLAESGTECQLETRQRPTALWKLVGTFAPRRGRRHEFVDPYQTTTNSLGFDTDSLHGRIVQ